MIHRAAQDTVYCWLSLYLCSWNTLLCFSFQPFTVTSAKYGCKKHSHQKYWHWLPWFSCTFITFLLIAVLGEKLSWYLASVCFCVCLHVLGLVFRLRMLGLSERGTWGVFLRLRLPQKEILPVSISSHPPPHLPPPSVLALSLSLSLPPCMCGFKVVFLYSFLMPSSICHNLSLTHTHLHTGSSVLPLGDCLAGHQWRRKREIAKQRGSLRRYLFPSSPLFYLPRLLLLRRGGLLPFVLQSQWHFTHLTWGPRSRFTELTG